jgi:hypothetical protein
MINKEQQKKMKRYAMVASLAPLLTIVGFLVAIIF